MASGRPVVATAAGGVGDVVKDGRTGFLVPPGDSALLADRIQHLLDDRTMAETMASRGRESALAGYTIETSARLTEQTYRELLGERRPSRRASIRRPPTG
jgi:glycosyltransferase involved in cell wall biosynthesis